MKSTPGVTKFELRLKKPEEVTVPMREMTDHIFHVKVKFKVPITEYKYQYATFALEKKLKQEDIQEQDRTKTLKKYMRLKTFFDFSEKNILGLAGKKQAVEHLVRFLIDNFDKPDMHFGTSAIIKELTSFFEAETTKHLYSSIFKECYN
jgi:translation elongation factor EF-G